jgi:methylase of polypeptide subunit release factors
MTTSPIPAPDAAPGVDADDLLDRLPARAVTSFARVGYHLGLANLVADERVLDLGSGSGMLAVEPTEKISR